MEAVSSTGYKCVLVFIGFVSYMLADGSYQINGIFYLLHQTEYSDKKYGLWLSIVYGLTYGFGQLMSLPCGLLIRRFGARNVAVLSGFLMCCGYSLSFLTPEASSTPTQLPPLLLLLVTFGFVLPSGCTGNYTWPLLLLQKHFKKNYAFACGIAMCGGGFGVALAANFAELLVDAFTWRGATLIIGAVCLNGAALALLIRPLQSDQYANANDADSSANDCDNHKNRIANKYDRNDENVKPCQQLGKQMLRKMRQPSTIAYYSSFMLNSFAIVLIINFTPSLLQHSSSSSNNNNSSTSSTNLRSTITLCTSAFGLASMLGNLAFGYAGSRLPTLIVESVAILCSACTTAALPAASQHSAVLTVTLHAFNGFCYGSRYCLMGPGVMRVIGHSLLDVGVGLLQLCNFFAFLPAPHAGEMLKQAYSSYTPVFYSAAAALLASALLRVCSHCLLVTANSFNVTDKSNMTADGDDDAVLELHVPLKEATL